MSVSPPMPVVGATDRLWGILDASPRRHYKIAAASDIHPVTFSDMLHGRRIPNRDQVERLAATLGTDPTGLFELVA